MINKKILAIDLILIVGTLVALLVVVGYAQPLLLYPVDDYTTTETKILFGFEKGNVVFIDDNSEFSSPEEVVAENGLIINLKPGVYYWKVQGAFVSEVRKLTVESEIDLKLRESADGENYEIVNAGNVELNVDVYQGDELVGKEILGVGDEEDVEGDKVIGRENE